MSVPDTAVQAAIHHRWRIRLLVVLAVFALGAAGSLVISLAYGESLVVPMFLWLGVACVAMAWHTVPRGIAAEERPSMARSAMWATLAIVAYVVVPVLLSQAGLLD